MNLMIPVFHTEFDPLKLSLKQNGKIPPSGDFGDFWWLFWLFSRQDNIMAFQFWSQFIDWYVGKCFQLKTHREIFFPLNYSSGPGWSGSRMVNATIWRYTTFPKSIYNILHLKKDDLRNASEFWCCVLLSSNLFLTYELELTWMLLLICS
mgnify:CR=1 FL=1